ncbi:MAG: hypothetical protein J6L24_02685 [Oscillospiraceae bacterium]|nr:hypothetical protein [Oscillospiraceae bacterium]
MKRISILRHYMKGIRLQALVLMVMLTWAMLWGVTVYGKVQYINADLSVLKSGDTDNASLVMYFPSQGDILNDKEGEYAQAVEAALESEAIVEDVFSIRVANPVSYEGAGISIVLYEPGMVDFFPGLDKYGIDFGAEPNGCILGSTMFGGLDTGDTVSLSFRNQPADFSVAGHITSPYRRMTLSGSSTDPRAGILFEDGGAVIMLATDEVMARLNTLARRITYNSNLIVVFTADSTAEERQQVLEAAAPKSLCCPFSEIIENTEADIAAVLKKELAQPLFLAVSAAVAYLSIAILTFKKKEKDTAILYLCGCSRRKCAILHFAVFQIFALIPAVINVLFVLIWPQIEWNYWPLVLKYPQYEALHPILLRLFHFFKTVTVSPSCLPVIFGYYACAAVISVAAVAASMARHTPLTYLRGASQ